MRPNPLDIAIVGMASHFPDAPDLYDFWTNVVGRRDSIADVDGVDGDEYWRKSDFFDPDPTALDKTYGHKAGFAPAIRFDPVEFKMPPLMLESISTAQIFALYVARQAMEDAGLAGAGARAFDRDRMGVILGGGGNGNTAFSLASRQQAPYLRRIMVNAGLTETVADDVIDRVKHLYLEWNEDSFPGFLGNVACGRIASYFDLGGTSYMVDAACASSLAAVKAAIGELADGSCDCVLTGGVNLENSVFSFMCFSKTPALSRSNRSRPFDAQSDGMMLGDGVGFLVLKRLADAQRDGDRIYAVIKGIQASSDGRAKSIFAPRHEGQVKAMRRAYEQAGVSPAQIQLVEAHGTGTASGDQTEIKSLRAIFESAQAAPGTVAVGSIKSQIGHTRCAAGAASMMKVALSLFHKVLPPTINVEQPGKDIGQGTGPFYVNTQTRPWFRPAGGAPRRAALSAFGFGGTNFHAILEEYHAEPAGAFRLNRRPEVVVLHAASPAQLLADGRALLEGWQSASAPAQFRRHQQAHGGAPQVPDASARLAFAADGPQEAARLLAAALKQLADRPGEDWEHPLGIYYKPHARPAAGRVVALFPGQGSQYVDMARDLAVDHPELRRAIEDLDAVAAAQGTRPLSPVIYPPPAFSEAEAAIQSQELMRTSRAQPAIGAVSAGCWKLLQGMGFAADFLAGHSYGELTALWAAGVFSDEDFHRASLARGAAVEGVANGHASDRGAMLAVPLGQPRVDELLRQFPGLAVANYNAPEQLVLGGSTELVRQAHAHLVAQQVRAQVLPVSAAFHTPLVQHACAPFESALRGLALREPAARVYSTATAQPHGSDVEALRALLVRQLVSPVRFSQTIEAIHGQGGDLFVEIGPKGVLGKLVGEVLKGRPHAVVSLNPSATGDAALSFKRALARLVAEGVPLHDLDPQAAASPAPREQKPGLSYTVGGGFFMPEKARRRRQHALRTGDTRLVDAFVAERSRTGSSSEVAAPARPAPTITTKLEETPAPLAEATAAAQTSKTPDDQPPPRGRMQAAAQPTGVQTMNSGTETDILGALDAQVRAQQVLSQVHQQFQLNQRDYIQLLDALMTRQCSLLEKFQGSPQLSAVVSSLSQSFQLLDKNQELYHVNHGQYFDNQQAILGEVPRAGRVSAAAAAARHAPLQALALPEAAAPAQPAQPVQPAQQQIAQQPVTQVAAAQPAPARAAAQVHAAQVHAAPAALAPVHAPKPSVPEVAPAQAAARPAAQPQAAVASAGASAEPAPTQAAAPARVLSAEDQALVRRFEALTQEDLVRQIVAIVSDRTGYPADMINEEMDLEADLGIDSIKRLEIFGAMFDQLSANVSYFQDAEQHKDMETFDIDAFSNIRKMAVFFKDTIAELLAHLKGEKGETPPPAVATDAPVQQARQAQPAAASNGHAELRETPPSEAPPLRNLGFVTSTRNLGEDHDAKKSSADPREDASAPVQRLISSDADQTKQAAVAQDPAVQDQAEEPVRRFRPRLHELPRPDQRELDVRAGSVWLLVDDGQGLGTALAQSLAARRQRVVRLFGAGTPPAPVKGVQDHVIEGTDEASLQTLLDRISYSNGPVAGLAYLLPAQPALQSLDEAWAEADLERARLAYTLAKLLQPGFARFEDSRSWFFLVTRIDGELGTAGRGLFPVATAGLTGLAKSLNIEWESTFCRAVDIDPQATPERAAAMLLEELADSRTDIAEIGRGAGGRRVGIAHERAPVDERSPVAGLGPDSVFVVTGGARGITADCVVALARQVPARFALLGRTRIDAPAPAWTAGASGVAALKAAAIRHLQLKGDQPTPVKVDRLLDEVIHADQVRHTLQQVHDAGGRAIYLACDITDRADVAAAVARAQAELGPVTGVIHGAGNLADKRIEKKTAADFERVFLTKVRGLECLLSALPAQQLRHVVLFSSVSGFFGNAGQTDYAMANESLNKFAWMIRARFPQVLVRSINWGPWDTGMVNEVLRRAYAQRGLTVIPAEAGVRRFVDEFRAGAGSEPQSVVGGDTYKVSPKVKRLPALTRVAREIRPSDNPFLGDHVVADRAVLPATAAACWMVQACEDLLPGYRAERLTEFRVLKGLVFGPEAQRIVAELRPVRDGADAGGERHVLAVSVLSEAGSIPQHRYEAQVHMTRAPAQPAPPLPGGWTAPDADADAIEGHAIYGDMGRGALLFHGPAFQGLQSLWRIDDRGLHAACTLAPVDAQRQGQFAATSFNPYVGDVLLQPPLAWLMLRSDEAGLPSHIESWEQFAPPAFGQPFQLRMQVTARTRATLVTEVTACDAGGRVLARISGLTFTVSERLRQTLAGAGKPDMAAAA